MKRIKDIKDIPVFLSNQRYDEFYQNMSNKRLKKEVRKRHKLFERLQHVLNDTYIIEDDFVQDKKKSTRLNKKNSNKNTVVVKITNTINGVKQILPPKTKSELIQDEKNSIIRAISGFTEPLYIDGKNGKILNYHSSDFTILPGFNFDNSPIIIPIMSCDNYQNLKNGNKFCESEPQNLEDYTKLPSIFLNLDFSDDVIIEELRSYLTLLRKQKNHQPTYLQTRAYLEKLKNYRILQVMDIIMWQYATDYHIQYDTLAMFLSGHRKDMYSGKRLKETIIPFAKNLLNSKSNEFGFFYYLVNKNDEV